MLTLFDEPAAVPAAAQVKALVQIYAHCEKRVAKWSAARVAIELAWWRRAEFLWLNRLREQNEERRMAGVFGRGHEREDAAQYLEEARRSEGDSVWQAIGAAAAALTDDEAERLAGYLIRLLRGEGQRKEGAA